MSTIVEVLRKALEYHQSGRFEEAETAYRQILARDPNNADALHLAGMLAYQGGRHVMAADYIGRAIRINSSIPAFHNNLGSVLQPLGRLEEALASFEQALRLAPNFAEAHVNVGNLLQQQGRFEEAIARYRQALLLKPESAEARNNLGNALRARGIGEEAVACYREALRLKPGYFDAWLNLSTALKDLGRLEEAEASCREALRLKPDLAEAYANLSAILLERERLEEAEASCREALRLKPDLVEALANLGAVLLEQQRYEPAKACCREALRLRPGYAEVHNNLGHVLLRQGRPEEAVDSYCEALRTKPDLAETHSSLGNAFRAQLKLREAESAYHTALRLQPDEVKAHWNLGMLLLLEGRFERGWQEYDWRWRAKNFPPYPFTEPRWDGSPLRGQTILLHTEQGLGDTLQFIRYIPLVKQTGATVVLSCQPRLVSLLRTVSGIDHLVPEGSALPDFDVYLPLLSLPSIFHTTLDNIPSQVPYLKAEPQLVERWRNRIASGGRYKVGLVWAGSSSHPKDRFRSLSLADFLPLAGIPGVAFYGLQKGPPAFELRSSPPGLEVTNLEEEDNQITDTAAIIENLDLVISVDTMVAHLAGALAKPVWVLLSYAPDWRWLLDREDSPWYPTLRLFRQPRLGDWNTVIECVARALICQLG